MRTVADTRAKGPFRLTLALALAGAGSVAALHVQDPIPAGLIVSVDMKEIGDVSFPVSCTGEGLQERFDRAVALLHHMTYEVSEREFRSVAESDPDCAMAHWGIAMTLAHPLWPGLPPDDVLRRGSSEVRHARDLGAKTERERAYIEAIGAFYDDWEHVDHATRLERWDARQHRVFSAFPGDDEAAAFHALLRIATASKTDLTYASNRAAGEMMEALFSRRPQHPAAMHYGIHAYDSPPLAARAVKLARAYGAIAPEVPHALHMPTHIFTRLGYWSDSISWNTRSRAVSRRIIIGGGVHKDFGHASDYLIYALLQMGEDTKAMAARRELFSPARFQDSFVNAYALAAGPARIVLERHRWEDAAALTPRVPDTVPWDKYPMCEAITHFARGLGAARAGKIKEAAESAERLERIAQRAEEADYLYWARQTVAQRETVRAWIAKAGGHDEEALRRMRAAADLEDSLDKHPVTPSAVLPARELYGDMLMDGQRYEEAIEAYEAVLRIGPNRFNSLLGAGRAAERLGQDAVARSYYSKLLDLAGKGDGARPSIAHARAYLEDRAR